MTKRYWYAAVAAGAACLDAGAWLAPHWTTAGRFAMTGAIILFAAISASVAAL